MKLGSLFDGSGGFPLSGALCGIEPIWASEVEPYPIAVTKSRFPNMKHLGDISKINGAEIEPVDIITFGSPCQDLSVAGKRAGLKHEDNGDDETTRSGLFMEAVRIIKEMREKTNGEYPRYAVWENVPGAFSSNKGEDFRIVLEELVKVVEPTAVMPEVPRFGWAYADSYCGDGWSLAYRVFDAQYWGVPQRRRRIYLVADFGGQRAREILFEREGLRGYFTEGRTPWKAVTADAERSIGADDRAGEIPYTLKIRSGVSVDSYGKAAGKGALIQKNLSATLGVSQDQYLFQPIGADPYNGDLTGDKSATLGVNCGISTGRNGVIEQLVLDDQGGSQITVRKDGKAPTLRAEMHGNVPCVMESAGFCPEQSAKTRGIGYEEETSPTLRAGVTPGVVCGFQRQLSGVEVQENVAPTILAAAGESGNNKPCVVYGVDVYNQTLTGDKAKTLNSAASDADHVPCAVYAVDQGGGKSQANVSEELSPTLTCTHGGEPAVCYSVENHPNDSRVKIDESGKVQALTGRMGTGGGNVPMVMETVALEGNGQRPSHHGDGYLESDKSYTLNATEVHGVAYSFDPGASRDVGVLFIEECGKTLTNGTCPGHHDGVVIALNETDPVLTASKASFFMNTDENLASTLVATDYKDPQMVCYREEEPIAIDRAFFNQGKNALYKPQTYEDGTVPTLVAKGPGAVATRYIVRRLTPTECARLQGFADRWGDIAPKSDFTDEEYRFWLEVRNTHANINGKAVKEYTKSQMLTWYNKLHTDSAEYKLWGNGIALPTALYVIQGIAEGERK